MGSRVVCYLSSDTFCMTVLRPLHSILSSGRCTSSLFMIFRHSSSSTDFKAWYVSQGNGRTANNRGSRPVTTSIDNRGFPSLSLIRSATENWFLIFGIAKFMAGHSPTANFYSEINAVVMHHTALHTNALHSLVGLWELCDSERLFSSRPQR